VYSCLAALVCPTGTAGAFPPTVYGTTCGLVTTSAAADHIGSAGTYSGFVYASATVEQVQRGASVAWFECVVEVNDVHAATVTSPPAVVTTALTWVDVPAGPADVVSVCTRVTVSDSAGTTTTDLGCVTAMHSTAPPPAICGAGELVAPGTCTELEPYEVRTFEARPSPLAI
jgi:hypothetical protein